MIAGRVRRRRHLPGRQSRRPRARRQAAAGGDVVQPERRRRGDAGGQPHASPPTTSTSTINNQILLGATFDDQATVDILANAGFSNIGGVQYFTNGLDTRTQGIDITADYKVPAGRSGTLDLNAGFNCHREQDHPRGSAAAGAGGRGLDRAGPARLGDGDRHPGRAARLARHPAGQLHRGPVQRRSAASPTTAASARRSRASATSAGRTTAARV